MKLANPLQSFGSFEKPRVLIEFSKQAFLEYFPSGRPYIACTASFEEDCDHEIMDSESHYSFKSEMPSDLTSFKYTFSSNSYTVPLGKFRLDICGCLFQEYTVDTKDYGEDGVRYRIKLSSKSKEDETYTTDDSEMTVKLPNLPFIRPGHETFSSVPPSKIRCIPVAELSSSDSGSILLLRRIWTYCCILFTLWPHQEFIALNTKFTTQRDPWVSLLLVSKLAQVSLPRENFGVPFLFGKRNRDTHVYLSRARFWQGAGPFGAKKWTPVLKKGDVSKLSVFISRNQGFEQELNKCTLYQDNSDWGGENGDLIIYRRFIPEVGKVLTFRLVDYEGEPVSADGIYSNKLPSPLPLVCEWDNIPFASASIHGTNREDCYEEKHDTKSFRVDEVKDKLPTTEEQLVLYRSLIHVRDKIFD